VLGAFGFSMKMSSAFCMWPGILTDAMGGPATPDAEAWLKN
jgi:hypothetical protein